MGEEKVEKQPRIISEEPWVVELIEGFDLGLLPKDLRESIIWWGKSIGKTIRSRDFILSILQRIASTATNILLTTTMTTVISTIITSRTIEKVLERFAVEKTLEKIKNLAK